MIGRRTWVASSVLFPLAAAVALAGLMMHSETTIAIPTPGESTPLSKLEYRARFVASIDSVTLELASAESDPVVVEWTFLGSNTDGQVHRVSIALRLLDEAGEQIAIYNG